jgi:hypothetical protein
MKGKVIRFGLAVLPAFVVALVLSVMLAQPVKAQTIEPGAGSSTHALVFLTSRALTTTSTFTQASTSAVGSLDNVGGWEAVEFWVSTTGITTTANITLTPQFSADGAYWANAQTKVISAGVQVNVSHTLNVSGTNGAAYIRLPIYGQYMRVVINTTGVLTPEVRAILRK